MTVNVLTIYMLLGSKNMMLKFILTRRVKSKFRINIIFVSSAVLCTYGYSLELRTAPIHETELVDNPKSWLFRIFSSLLGIINVLRLFLAN